MTFKKESKKPVSVILSKRANVFFLEYCRIMCQGDRVVYLTQSGRDIESFFNIPEHNTVFLMLGNGTSITQAAVRKLADAHVLVGFCGGGGSPPYGSVDVAFLNMESEYRPTEYMQRWADIWFDQPQRLSVAKFFCAKRIEFVSKYWGKFYELQPSSSSVDLFRRRLGSCSQTHQILLEEASWSKSLYKSLATASGVKNYTRNRSADENLRGSVERINDLIDHGNYIAYGYAATTLSCLGISFMFPVLHGKTRRGALVFDLADIFKDALILPLAFEMGKSKKSNQEFREALIERLFSVRLLDQLFRIIKEVCENPL